MDHLAEQVVDALAGKRPGNPIRKQRTVRVRHPNSSQFTATIVAGYWYFVCPWCGGSKEYLAKHPFTQGRTSFRSRKHAKDGLRTHTKNYHPDKI